MASYPVVPLFDVILHKSCVFLTEDTIVYHRHDCCTILKEHLFPIMDYTELRFFLLHTHTTRLIYNLYYHNPFVSLDGGLCPLRDEDEYRDFINMGYECFVDGSPVELFVDNQGLDLDQYLCDRSQEIARADEYEEEDEEVEEDEEEVEEHEEEGPRGEDSD